jgi:hypothetical protein
VTTLAVMQGLSDQLSIYRYRLLAACRRLDASLV